MPVITTSLVCLLDNESTNFVEEKKSELSKETGSIKALARFPHFSLRNDFQVEIGFKELVDELENLAKESPKMKLTINSFGFYSQWRVIYFGINPGSKLQDLHNKSMKIIQKYRNGWIPPELVGSSIFVGKQCEYVQKYGYQFSFEYYSPHITLVGPDMKEKVFQQTKKLLEDEGVNRVIYTNSIALVDWTSRNKIVKKFPLKE